MAQSELKINQIIGQVPGSWQYDKANDLLVMVLDKEPEHFPIVGQVNLQNLNENFNDRWKNALLEIIKVIFEIYSKALEKTIYSLETAADDEVLRLNKWPPIYGTTHRAKSRCGIELLRSQAKGGINGSVNNNKFYQRTGFHNAIGDAIEEISIKAGVLLQAKFNGSNSETKTKSILGSLVLACIKGGDEIAAMNTETFETMLKDVSKQGCMVCSDYRIIIDNIFKPREESQEERIKRRRKEEAFVPNDKKHKR